MESDIGHQLETLERVIMPLRYVKMLDLIIIEICDILFQVELLNSFYKSARWDNYCISVYP